MPALHKVNINVDRGSNNVVFDPADLTVDAGDQISWTNNDSVPHLPGVINDDGSCVGLVDDKVPPRGGVSSIFSPTPQVDSNNNQIQYEFQYTCCDNRNIIGSMTVQPTP